MTDWIGKERDKTRKKAAGKLGEIFICEDAEVPDAIIVEQASSFLTARYVASLFREDESIVDLTAGLGVNVVAFSKRSSKVVAIEREIHRAEALRHNLDIASIGNVEVVCADCLDWLRKTRAFGIANFFADPSRRDSTSRFVTLKDCSPDTVEIVSTLSGMPQKSRLLVKASPLLDFSAAIREVRGIAGFRIIEVKREVKELLIEILPYQRDTESTPYISCVILSESEPPKTIDFLWTDQSKNRLLSYLPGREFIVPGTYILEPSPSVMKSGMFGALLEKFRELTQLSRDTHLFFSTEVPEGFPGRIFRVKALPRSSELKKLKGESWSVISRNHPAKAPEIEERYRLRQSDSDFLIAFRVGKEKTIVMAEKV